MKVRSDFVTNSSSSSFFIAKKDLTSVQLYKIRNVVALDESSGMEDSEYAKDWNIEENDTYIAGDTFMDNFFMQDYFEKIGVDGNIVQWDFYPFDINKVE